MIATGRERQARARELLAAFDLDAFGEWAAREVGVRQALRSLVFDPDEVVRWRAIEALGRAARAQAGRDLEAVREQLRRTLWLMNDESGGLLWCGPQLMATTLANVPALAPEYVALLAGFLEEEPFRVGTRWAVWRLATVADPEVARLASDLVPSLTDPAAAVRGHAALALRALQPDVTLAALAPLASDEAVFSVFDHRVGRLRSVTVGAVVARPF
jgi:HEAT repeat protein